MTTYAVYLNGTDPELKPDDGREIVELVEAESVEEALRIVTPQIVSGPGLWLTAVPAGEASRDDLLEINFMEGFREYPLED